MDYISLLLVMIRTFLMTPLLDEATVTPQLGYSHKWHEQAPLEKTKKAEIRSGENNQARSGC